MRKIMIKDWSWCRADRSSSSFKVDIFLGHPAYPLISTQRGLLAEKRISSYFRRQSFLWVWQKMYFCISAQRGLLTRREIGPKVFSFCKKHASLQSWPHLRFGGHSILFYSFTPVASRYFSIFHVCLIRYFIFLHLWLIRYFSILHGDTRVNLYDTGIRFYIFFFAP